MGTILAFDIGTSSVKGGLFDRSGAARWLHREPLTFGEPHSGGRHPDDSWVTERWVRAIQSTLDAHPCDEKPDAVVLSGNGPTVVPVADDGTPVADALLWLDRRERRIAGQPSFFLPKIAWLIDNEPKIREHTRFFLTCPEYIDYLLCGVPHATSPSEAFDRYLWDMDGLSAYAIDGDCVAPVTRPGEVVGKVTARGEQLFSIPRGTPVIAGGPDFLMSLLGTATTEEGRTCDRAGTSEGINHCSPRPTDSPDVRCLPHVVPGLWNVAGVLSSTGRIFEWYRTISRQRSVGYERMLAEIDAAGYDREPYFFPSTHKGAAWEFSHGMFYALKSDQTSADMGRGVVHAIGYAVRQSIDSLRAAGCAVEELRACGGQAKNPVWNQLKADITGVPVATPEVLDAELVGDLCCALAGLGDYASPWTAAADMVRIKERYEPSAARYERFSEGYEDYTEVYTRFLNALHP